MLLFDFTGIFSGCKPACDSYADVPLSHSRYPEGSILYGMPPAVYALKGSVKKLSRSLTVAKATGYIFGNKKMINCCFVI
ncbi:MAG: hypothetical protein FWF70_06745 [Bacteroidetes bacterium]|nr:hypothetical protein [Bacteroidota bacterium]MCL1968697.1 hypothetical protein [Bacteroidota bacterium]